MKTFLLPALLCLSLFAGFLPAAEELRLLVDGSMNGNLVGCHCTSSPKSGLVKRAAFIKEYRAKYPGTLVVGTGDLLEFGTDEKFASLVLDCVASVGYDALALGDQEFLAGTDFTAKMMKRLPLLSANLKVEGWLTDTAFPPTVIKSAGKLKVAFVAVNGSNIFRYFPDKRLKEKLKIEPIPPTLSGLLPNLLKQADLVVLLTHQGLDQDLALAKTLANSGVGLILGGHSQDLTRKPTGAGGIPIIHSGASGNWEVELILKVDKQKAHIEKARFHFFKYPDGDKPVTKEVILGDEPWAYETAIHDNPPDDPDIARMVRAVGGGH